MDNNIIPDEPEKVVLIVDDTPANLKIIGEFLGKQGFKTSVATSGEKAIIRAEKVNPDIILLDIRMPGMDGFEICSRLKSKETTKDIPVIFMTSMIDIEDKIKAFSSGGVDYITKPVQHDELLARLTTHLEIKKYRDHLEDEVSHRTKELHKEIAMRK